MYLQTQQLPHTKTAHCTYVQTRIHAVAITCAGCCSAVVIGCCSCGRCDFTGSFRAAACGAEAVQRCSKLRSHAESDGRAVQPDTAGQDSGSRATSVLPHVCFLATDATGSLPGTAAAAAAAAATAVTSARSRVCIPPVTCSSKYWGHKPRKRLSEL